MPDLLLLLSQVAGILFAARIVGGAVGLIGQPRVIGEMLAGIMLGPSVLGALAPGVSQALFPPGSLGFISVLSQIGLVFFMFLIGLEIDLHFLRGRGHATVATSQASIMVPFFLGAVLSLLLYPRLSDDSVSFTAFALFLGAAMSVTAFPVLARLLAERGLLKTKLGTVAIAAAAVNDVTAWCILAVVIVVARATEAAMPIPLMLVGTVLYTAFMLTVVRWALRLLERAFQRRGELSEQSVALVVFLVLASAWVTERLGVHAVFGAFLAGVAMPRDEQLVKPVRDRFHDLMVILFLPLFFAFTGLRTSMSLIQGELWAYCALIVLVAVAGKVGGAALAAHGTGMSWRESWALGTLMNTRGLMELVILNVGLDIGVLSPALFAMMVIMALVTTFMTSPVLALIYPRGLLEADQMPAAAAAASPDSLAADTLQSPARS
ncbi:MAG TPA: cation:proton antiporter [Gemmatimonadales bacterium]|nr:cation:proton antiporter [Gemmatimonadales bacterium]